jgi:hypothetical protein
VQRIFVAAWRENDVVMEILKAGVIVPMGVVAAKTMIMILPIRPIQVLVKGAMTMINRRPHTTQSR